MTFYLLSMITGVLECGWIAYGAVHGLPLWQILCFPLAYHLGNRFPKPFSLGKRTLIVLSGLAFSDFLRASTLCVHLRVACLSVRCDSVSAK